jgi:hypothetical protein
MIARSNRSFLSVAVDVIYATWGAHNVDRRDRREAVSIFVLQVEMTLLTG